MQDCGNMHKQLTKSSPLGSSFSQVLIHWRGAFMYFSFLFNDSVSLLSYTVT